MPKFMEKEISELYFPARRSNELYNFHTHHELEQKSCELRFATIKNLQILSSKKKTKFRLTFYQDTRMSGRGVQTDLTRVSVLKQRLLEVLQVGHQLRNSGFYS